MKIAIFLNSEMMNILDKRFVLVVIFDIKDNIVVGVEKDFHILKNINTLALWLISKEIKEIYIEEIEDPAKVFLENIYIKVKTFDEIKDNPLLKAFMF